ncbi:hypothetical protein [Neobacillus vireti]|uniref:hypothetical protein n=1 Tax=Neobacillus vireti TaxID=220686 RepID=UPI003000D11E
MPNNFYASPSLDKETRLITNRGLKWRRGIGAKRLIICHQKAAGLVRCAGGQELSCYIRKRMSLIKPLKYAKTAG